MITELEPLEIPGHQASVSGGATHPMRTVTRQAAGLDPGDWTATLRSDVAMFFDDLAPDWHLRTSPERDRVVADALERSGLGGGVALEVGSGIGAYTSAIGSLVDAVVSIELSGEMLARQPSAPGLRMQADASTLPFADGTADAIVLVNMFLFPAEVDRVLAPDGLLVWVNSSGAETPIHLDPADVERALPGEWSGVRARAGIGIWCALERAGR